MIIKVSSFKCFFVSLIFVFADILGGENLNLVYFLGIYLVISLLKDKKYYKRIIALWLPLLLLALLTSQFSGVDQNYIKTFVYLSKLFLCITLMYYIETKLNSTYIHTIFNYVVDLVIILLLISVIWRNNNLLWRLNDIYNDFSKVRLQLLFTEPSVLGQFSGIIILIGFFSILEYKISLSSRLKFALLVITLILSFSMSGITYTILSCLLLLFMFYCKDIYSMMIKKKVFLILIVGVLALLLFLTTNNVLTQRLIAIISGDDGSFNFRWNVAFYSLDGILRQTHYFGMGMGNMNTSIGESILLSQNVDHFFANSFLYFIAENGIPGILYILYLMFFIMKGMLGTSLKDSLVYLKYSLFFFVFICQIAGSYFTDPLIWCIYGLIRSHRMKKDDLLVFKERR